MKIRSFREITLISFRDVTSKAFSWKRSICLWQTFREIRVCSQGLVQKRKAIVKKSFCLLTLLFCKHINESTLWSASNNILWPCTQRFWNSAKPNVLHWFHVTSYGKITLVIWTFILFSLSLKAIIEWTVSKSNCVIIFQWPIQTEFATSLPEGIKQLCLHILRSHWAEKDFRTRSEKWRMYILLLAAPIGKE